MNIGQWVVLVLLSLPILEIYVLIKLIGALGFLLTLALLLSAAALGTFLLRTQGWTTWMRAQQALARGEVPTREAIEGGLLALGGLLLLIPGFLSDLLALCCLIPVSRRRLARYILEQQAAVQVHTGRAPEAGAPRTIEGEYRREE